MTAPGTGARPIGLTLPSTPEPGALRLERFLTEAACVTERLGFSGAYQFHAVGRGFATTDPLAALAVAATVTDSVELGTCILQVGLRHSVALAHRILTATWSRVSGSRSAWAPGRRARTSARSIATSRIACAWRTRRQRSARS